MKKARRNWVLGSMAAVSALVLGAGSASAALIASAGLNYQTATSGQTTASFGGGLGLPDTFGTGHWNYYLSDNANPTLGTLTLLSWKSIGLAGNSGYGGTGSYGLPAVAKTKIFSDGATPAADQLAWHPSTSGSGWAVVRWTAGTGETGTINLAGMIDKTDEPSHPSYPDSFAVFLNGASQFSTSIYTGTQAFNFDLVVAANDNVDFVLGGSLAAEAKLTANISIVPEPASGLLLFASAAGLGLLRRKLRG